MIKPRCRQDTIIKEVLFLLATSVLFSGIFTLSYSLVWRHSGFLSVLMLSPLPSYPTYPQPSFPTYPQPLNSLTLEYRWLPKCISSSTVICNSQVENVTQKRWFLTNSDISWRTQGCPKASPPHIFPHTEPQDKNKDLGGEHCPWGRFPKSYPGFLGLWIILLQQ